MFYVYVLKLDGDTYYVGFSEDVKKRVEAHLSGLVPRTKKLLPAKLVFYAAFETKRLALSFEKYLKSSSGFAFRNKRLVGGD